MNIESINVKGTVEKMQNYQNYGQPYQPPFQDRLSQLQNQYIQTVPPVMQQPMTTPQTNQGFLWVQGEAGAKSYLVAPNTAVLLMDSEGSRFYIKSTDNAGLPTLRTFEFTEITQGITRESQSTIDNLDNKYVTRAEYDGLRAQYMEIMDKLNNYHVSDKAYESKQESTSKGSQSKSKGGNNNE